MVVDAGGFRSVAVLTCDHYTTTPAFRDVCSPRNTLPGLPQLVVRNGRAEGPAPTYHGDMTIEHLGVRIWIAVTFPQFPGHIYSDSTSSYLSGVTVAIYAVNQPYYTGR